MHCFHYSDDLFNTYCIHSISSLFFKYPKTWRRILYISTFTNHCYFCYQRKWCFKLRQNLAQSDLKGECRENRMTEYKMQEDVGNFIWMGNECECLFFVTQKSVMFLFVGDELWSMQKVQAYNKIALIKISGFTKKKHRNSWKWAGFSRPILHCIPSSFSGLD